MTAKIPLLGGQLQKEVVAAARGKGWLVAHFATVKDFRGVWRTPATADGKGFPDLVLVRDRLIMVEIKGDGDRLSVEQVIWRDALIKAGIEYYTWTRKEWFDGEVDRVLA